MVPSAADRGGRFVCRDNVTALLAAKPSARSARADARRAFVAQEAGGAKGGTPL
jgi:hypothetical protein